MQPDHSHYFDADPAAPAQERTFRVRLAGRDVTVTSARGVFSPSRLDPGTAVLLKEVPDPPERGTFLDLGCGWGPIALTLGLLSPGATVHAVDVNRRSLELTARNAENLGLDGIHVLAPAEADAEAGYDVIWSNPPIRIGKPALRELLCTWLPRLAPGGDAYLVVAKNLGGDSLQSWLAGALAPGLQVERFSSAKGFRIIHVTRPEATENTPI